MSNAMSRLGTRITSAITTGRNPIQHICISWSYRRRGSVARNQTKTNANTQVFSASTIACVLMNVSLTISSGITYPPKNRIAVSELISTIDAYSARKKKTKMIAECSVKNPATSSDSASGRSNGVRFVSASAEIKKIIASGSRGTTNHTACWSSIIVVIWNEPVSTITVRIAELRISS